MKKKSPSALAGLLLLALLSGVSFGQGAGIQPVRPPPGLGVVVRPNGPQMEAEFTNNTQKELAIALGEQKCRLKPGKTSKFLFQKQEPLQVAEVVPQGQQDKISLKLRVSSVIVPRANQTNLKIPNG